MPYKNPKSPKAKLSNLKKDRKYKKIHREQINAKAKERRKNDPEYRKRMIEKTERYIARNREKVLLYKKKHNLEKNHGLSWETYEVILKSQNNACAICEKRNQPKRRFAVDHDHKTGRVRGLLCDKCNLGLGHFGDDISLFKQVIFYLKKYA